MERPTVLLAMADNGNGLAADLGRAGFDTLTDSAAALATLTDGGRVDLAVIDCDLPAEMTQPLYAAIHGDTPVPTLLLFGDEIPEFATTSSSTRDEYAVKPIPSDALVYRLQALLIRSGKALPGDEAALTTTTAEDGTIIGEGRVISIFAPKGGVGKTTISVNTAVALREQTRANVLLFDADVGVGNVTSVLAVKYRMGLADLADSAPEEWTDAAFEAVRRHARALRRSRPDLGQRPGRLPRTWASTCCSPPCAGPRLITRTWWSTPIRATTTAPWPC